MKRHQEILEILQQDKYVEVSDLCDKLDVSAVTIRKDLKLLEDKGLLFRTHGGASLDNPYMKDRPVNEKEKISIEEKNGIAQAAANLISENDSFMIASGTTVQALAKAINIQGKLNVITSSLNVAVELLKNKDYEVIQLGGNVRHSSSSVIGHYANFILKDISCNQLFIGVDGIDLDYGCTTTSLEEAALNQQMIASAQKTIVLADSSKFGKKSFGKICGLDSVHHIITDSGISQKVIDRIKLMGIKITVV
ncbi:DeoR/GlpR family DNA-binding transcription regulator [Mesonia sp.]|uniref:DeoR/GlpR family DNA-binding transcription regulator n=1 Tax=Mesonia sp. TaxID=1960830 RepID=UPI00175650C6|nr:DeoR/GlpR family DNA-binding transcription regulator [Mesonia sp.]HIB36606.1 DeoR/GlpR transcriptional regulator [Mesonia sp.]HIO27946.1 DeoR/GlpR transcriptional regulator [Flavobacteriaceae bacterium]